MRGATGLWRRAAAAAGAAPLQRGQGRGGLQQLQQQLQQLQQLRQHRPLSSSDGSSGAGGAGLAVKSRQGANAVAQAGLKAKPVPDFHYQPLFEDANPVDTPYYKLEEASKHVSTFELDGQTCVRVGYEALRQLSRAALHDVSHLLRPGHLQQLRNILDDPEASENDRFVAMQLLKNAAIAADMVLPSCQDTGTAIFMAKKGQYVFTEGKDEAALSHGAYDTFTQTNLRYSQVAPLTMYEEKNTGTNLPAQVDVYATPGNELHVLTICKGGGSANKSFLFQKTKSLLNPAAMADFIKSSVLQLGTAACPPYHIALVVGGLSAELNLKTVKLASVHYLDSLPTSGNEHGRAFRDLEMEADIKKITEELGVGAQFGGKYFAHDVRVVRLPRHGASCPVGLGVSCSADRQAKGKITKDGVFLEALERDPGRFLPDVTDEHLGDKAEEVHVDLNRPMAAVLEQLRQYPVRTRLSLTGTLIVARDIAHARMKEMMERGEDLPQYMKDHPVYYAGPAKTPVGMPSGSFGPTTAGRMDPYVANFQAHGGSMIMLAKGNRSKQVTDACKRFGGFYLGSIGGPAAELATNNIRKVEVLDMDDLGMEAVWRIEVENFPAFVIVDDKGNDFFSEWTM